MAAILPFLRMDNDQELCRRFMRHQVNWILAEEELHAQGRAVFALAEKSVRIGWTHGDAFKNFRKRLRYPKRDYLFVTKDYPSAVEYARVAYELGGIYNYTRDVLSHGEEYLKVPRADEEGRATGFTDEVKIGCIKFVNGSRILAFSAHPQAMAVYGGDVGLDEFAKHPNAELLWETAQGRVAWGFDLAVWSAHDGEDTLFNQFAREARAGVGPWNLYYRVTMADAIELGLLDTINSIRGSKFSAEQFLADCRARCPEEGMFQQAYMCNPMGDATAAITEWGTIQRCRFDYEIERVHLESDEVLSEFGQFDPAGREARAQRITQFLLNRFPKLFAARVPYRLGFDVAASGTGDLAAFYFDEPKGPDLWLRALLTCRTEDWHFLGSALFTFLGRMPRIQAAGDETGPDRQICWEAAQHFPGRFVCVNFTSKKHDLGFALMNQLAVAEKRFPKAHEDIAADYFALRKNFQGRRWVFSESANPLNRASHCDIAWAGALASYVHAQRKSSVGARLG